jgi:hypothetical protein
MTIETKITTLTASIDKLVFVLENMTLQHKAESHKEEVKEANTKKANHLMAVDLKKLADEAIAFIPNKGKKPIICGEVKQPVDTTEEVDLSKAKREEINKRLHTKCIDASRIDRANGRQIKIELQRLGAELIAELKSADLGTFECIIDEMFAEV